MYEIRIDKKKVFGVENTKPEKFEHVKVYTSGPWQEAVNGKIRNLRFETKDEDKKKASVSIGDDTSSTLGN